MCQAAHHPPQASRRLAFASVGLVCLVLVCLQASPAFAEDTQNARKVVRIGVLAKRGFKRCKEKWTPTADYLSDNIPGHSFKIVPLGFDEVIPAVGRGGVDFVLCNPSLYVEAEVLYGASRLVTLNNLRDGKKCTTYGGVIFHRADRKDIHSLADLKGKRFMAVEERSHEACLYIRKFEASVVLTGITPGRLQFREDKS